MTPTPEQLLAVADWLDECDQCGVKHTYRPMDNGSFIADDGRYVGRFTWAAPDGHAYFRRVYTLTSGTANAVPAALRKAAEEGA